MFWLWLYRGSSLATCPVQIFNLKSTWSFSLLPFYSSLPFNPFQILNYPLQKLEYLLQILDYPLQMLEYPLQVLPLDLLPADKLHRPSQRTIPP